MRLVPRGDLVPVAPNDDPGPYGSLADMSRVDQRFAPAVHTGATTARNSRGHNVVERCEPRPFRTSVENATVCRTRIVLVGGEVRKAHVTRGQERASYTHEHVRTHTNTHARAQNTDDVAHKTHRPTDYRFCCRRRRHCCRRGRRRLYRACARATIDTQPTHARTHRILHTRTHAFEAASCRSLINERARTHQSLRAACALPLTRPPPANSGRRPGADGIRPRVFRAVAARVARTPFFPRFSGSREFVEKFFFRATALEIRLGISASLSCDSRPVATVASFRGGLGGCSFSVCETRDTLEITTSA